MGRGNREEGMKGCEEGGRRKNARCRKGSRREGTGRRVGTMKELRLPTGSLFPSHSLERPPAFVSFLAPSSLLPLTFPNYIRYRPSLL